MTNVEDCLGYIVEARKYVLRGELTAACECLDQARKLWEAETSYWQNEIAELSRAVLNATSDRETARIHNQQHNQHVTWNERTR